MTDTIVAAPARNAKRENRRARRVEHLIATDLQFARTKPVQHSHCEAWPSLVP